MVRYQGDNEMSGGDEPPTGIPARSDLPPVWPTIIWTLLLLAAMVVIALLRPGGV